MRCSCIRCGAYMVHREKDLESGCICPECFAVCSACIGNQNQDSHIFKKVDGHLVIPEDLQEKYGKR